MCLLWPKRMILVLDFDGVIVDSAYECMLVANTAYHTTNKRLLPDRLLLPVDDLASEFLQKRYFVRIAGEYWLLWHCLYNEIDIVDQTDFKELIPQYKNQITAFEKQFYAIRSHVMKTDANYWFGLHRLFDEFNIGWEAVSRFFNDVYVASMKNKKSIAQLLCFLDIDMNPQKIMGREFGSDKKDIIALISEKTGHQMTDIIFVDDHYDQLRTVSTLGVKCCLAEWGYWSNNPADIESPVQTISNLNETIDIAGK